MAATGDGTGGKSVASTTSYQTLFNSTENSGSDGQAVHAYSVFCNGEDVLVKVTYRGNSTPKIYNATNGVLLPVSIPDHGSPIIKVEVKGDTGVGSQIYGNILQH